MKFSTALLIAGYGLFSATAPVNAAAICDCCDAAAGPSCPAVCAAFTMPAGQCAAVVDFTSELETSGQSNPLYDVSLRNVHFGAATRLELEAFRRLLETARASAEIDRKASIAQFKRKKIDNAAVAIAAKTYDAAIVNYYLGLRAYREKAKGP